VVGIRGDKKGEARVKKIGRRGSFNKLFLPKKKYAKRFDQTFLKFVRR
jgi:hypothetical protein